MPGRLRTSGWTPRHRDNEFSNRPGGRQEQAKSTQAGGCLQYLVPSGSGASGGQAKCARVNTPSSCELQVDAWHSPRERNHSVSPAGYDRLIPARFVGQPGAEDGPRRSRSDPAGTAPNRLDGKGAAPVAGALAYNTRMGVPAPASAARYTRVACLPGVSPRPSMGVVETLVSLNHGRLADLFYI